ncbi:hypothetical protein [Rhizobium sp. K102]|uniref:hypothetical protein n=1 Tax=Rhizobium sp. K102 TaxID=2918527 RepID=UPI001EFBA105|nr:hypothetical protein [Rhizobium sp. K102]
MGLGGKGNRRGTLGGFDDFDIRGMRTEEGADGFKAHDVMLAQHKRNLKRKTCPLKTVACKSFGHRHNNFAHVLNFVIRPLR